MRRADEMLKLDWHPQKDKREMKQLKSVDKDETANLINLYMEYTRRFVLSLVTSTIGVDTNEPRYRENHITNVFQG